MFNKLMMFWKESWLLLVLSVLFGVLLAIADAAWKPRIEQNAAMRFNRIALGLLPSAQRFELLADGGMTITIGGKLVAVDIRQARDASGQCVGWAFVCEGSGFADKIRLVVAVDAAFDKLLGFGVLSSNETPGFGDKIKYTAAEGGFYQPQFVGAPVGMLTLVKTGDPTVIDEHIVAISGATVTSQAVVDMLNAYLLPVKHELKVKGLLTQ